MNASKVHHPNAENLFQNENSYLFVARYTKAPPNDQIDILRVK
jgi:hypothetical protein